MFIQIITRVSDSEVVVKGLLLLKAAGSFKPEAQLAYLSPSLCFCWFEPPRQQRGNAAVGVGDCSRTSSGSISSARCDVILYINSCCIRSRYRWESRGCAVGGGLGGWGGGGVNMFQLWSLQTHLCCVNIQTIYYTCIYQDYPDHDVKM